jgi:hypothetical protein
MPLRRTVVVSVMCGGAFIACLLCYLCAPLCVTPLAAGHHHRHPATAPCPRLTPWPCACPWRCCRPCHCLQYPPRPRPSGTCRPCPCCATTRRRSPCTSWWVPHQPCVRRLPCATFSQFRAGGAIAPSARPCGVRPAVSSGGQRLTEFVFACGVRARVPVAVLQFHPTDKNTVVTVDDVSRAHVWRGDTAEKVASFRVVDMRHPSVRASSITWLNEQAAVSAWHPPAVNPQPFMHPLSTFHFPSTMCLHERLSLTDGGGVWV